MTPMESSLEQRLTHHVVDTGYPDLDAETVRCCKKLVMDSLGVVFPGSRAPGCPEIVELLRSWQSRAGASVMLTDVCAPPPMAAMANSAMMHALDFDDTLDASALHTFVSVLPAALAAAEHRGGVDGRELITALVLGVDVICRISLAIDRPLSWIRTATCGSFGAAAAAGKILGLNREEMANAFGVVYAQTSGNAQGLIEGRLVKRMQPGFAASAGVLSAFLAARGVTGSQRFLTGPYGYYSLYERDDYHPERITASLGEHFTVGDLSIKPFPCCRMTHSAIAAALKARERIASAEEIAHIRMSVSSMVAEMVGKPFRVGTNPQVDAQFSIPYTTACALIRGDVFLVDFEVDRISDPAVQELARRVQVLPSPELPAKDIYQAEMTVTRTDGEAFTERVAVPPGNPENPMSSRDCREKFHKCIDYSGLPIAENARNELLSMIETLEAIPDAGDLVRAMIPQDRRQASSEA
ncbi:MAG: MmgE/PrpD family protein [Desulfobacteraceae bacterium]|nr:MmgE/PrpD family protein [Desulfobacteraceae bacterium]